MTPVVIIVDVRRSGAENAVIAYQINMK